MKVFARHSLAGAGYPDEPALLLEGSWSRESQPRQALDDLIDARRAWIDHEASRLAHAVAAVSSIAYLNERKLRYYFVKLLRIVAFFEDRSLPNRLELVVARGRDEDYADLFAELCARRSVELRVQWRDAPHRPPPSFPPNPLWRRLAGWANRLTRPRWSAEGRPRVVLCGSRRVLDSVCGELLARGSDVAWLYDRFATKTWLHWRRAGVAQWICNSDQAGAGLDSREMTSGPPDLDFGDVHLGRAASHFLSHLEQHFAPRQLRLAARLDGYFRRHHPTLLVLDEDATPMARAAVAVARQRGVRSAVVQHGAPRVRFGFAPLVADAICVWGESSRRQLLEWGVPERRIHVTGWPGGTSNLEPRTANGERGTQRLLLFATTMPADDRPDAVSFHLTTNSYRRMLRIAFAAVAKVADARLTVKLHPRCGDAGVFHDMAQDFPRLTYRIVSSGGLAELLADTDCVLNCTSSAGIEAARQGVPVIELIPEGSEDLLPAAEWGAFGTAHDAEELEVLLRRALALGRTGPRSMEHVFAAAGQPAAGRTVDALLSLECGDKSPHSHEKLGAA